MSRGLPRRGHLCWHTHSFQRVPNGLSNSKGICIVNIVRFPGSFEWAIGSEICTQVSGSLCQSLEWVRRSLVETREGEVINFHSWSIIKKNGSPGWLSLSNMFEQFDLWPGSFCDALELESLSSEQTSLGPRFRQKRPSNKRGTPRELGFCSAQAKMRNETKT